MRDLAALTRGLFDGGPLEALTRGLIPDAQQAPAVHLRTLIRHRARQVLLDAGATADRVHPSRATPVQASELPTLLVYTTDEEVLGRANESPRELDRQVQLVVEVVDRFEEELDDRLDAIALIVETVLQNDSVLRGGVAAEIQLESTEIEFVGDGDAMLARARIEFGVHYRTEIGQVYADPWLTSTIEYDVKPADGNVDASDEVSMQEDSE